ncbi:MAG: 4Fe-4S binding protein [Kofleriaceae bacterium]
MSLLKLLGVRRAQGQQALPSLREARPLGFHGRPALRAGDCAACDACVAACPTGAVSLPLAIDLGRCTFCDACARACPDARIELTNEVRMGATRREGLLVAAAPPGGEGARAAQTRIRADRALARRFGRSLKLRQVSAGGCNACELELNAVANVNFDLQRHGIEWVASPRHADALVLSGALTKGMRDAVRLCWDAMPEPKVLIAVGACAISGGLYDGAAGLDRSFLDEIPPSLYVPGCPPHPLTFINAVLDLLDRP